MLGFIISTIAFSIAAYGLNRAFDTHGIEHGKSRNLVVLVFATVVSIGVGWIVDKLDGDADKPQKPMTEVIQSGDPVALTKMLIGIN